MRLCVFLLLVGFLGAEDAPTITYIKSFPGSVPAYVEITLHKDGRGEYKEAPDDPSPLKFQLMENEVFQIFGLAEKLDRFRRPLESNLKVAKMGLKTFRYQDGRQNSEVKFNYTLDPDGQLLLDWFERITESELRLINLERAARFDRLGVNQALLELEVSWDRKRLVGVTQFLPVLERISKNATYVNIARERAASLAEAFRSHKTTE